MFERVSLFKKIFMIAIVLMVTLALYMELPAQALNVSDDKEAHSNNGTEGKKSDNTQPQAPQKKTGNNVPKRKVTTKEAATKKVTTKKSITPSVKPAPVRVPSETLPPELKETFPKGLTQLGKSFLTDWDFDKMTVRWVNYDMYSDYLNHKLYNYKNYAEYKNMYGKGFYSGVSRLQRFDDGGIGLGWGYCHNFIVPSGWEARITPIEVKNSNGEIVKLAKGLNYNGIVKTYGNNEYIIFKSGTIVEVYHDGTIYPRWLNIFDEASLREFNFSYGRGGREEWLKSVKLIFYRVR